MEIIESIFGSITRAMGLLIFAASAMFVAWAAFQYMTAQGDPQAQLKARNQMIGVGMAMVLGGFAGFFPGLFNDLILRPAGIGVTESVAGCDDFLKAIINPRTGNYGATADQVNEAVLLVQQRNEEACHRNNWSPQAVDVAAKTDADGVPSATAGEYGFEAGLNECFSENPSGPVVQLAANTATSDGALYVGQAKLVENFYAIYPGGDDAVTTDDVLIPVGHTRRDGSGNLMVYFGTATGATGSGLPLDGAHCWYYRGGQLQSWFSNRDN